MARAEPRRPQSGDARSGDAQPGDARQVEGRPVYPQAVLDLFRAGGDRPVFEHGARIVTADEMLDIVGRISAGLRTAGIGPGDGVAMLLGVTPEAFGAMIAAHVVGARVAGVRPGLSPEQLRHILGHDIAAVVVDPSTTVSGPPWSTGTSAPRLAPDGPTLLAVGPVDGLPDLTATPADHVLTPSGRPDDIARIIYTSGSTGAPKGCAQSYAALTAAWAPDSSRWPPAVRDLAARLHRYLVFGSLSSQVMMEYGVLTLAAGGTMVVAEPGEGRPLFPDAIARLGATASVITVPRLYRLVAAQRADPVDLGTLRALLVSGSPLEPGRLAEAISVLGPVIYHGYGQTETGMITMVTPAELASSPGRLATVGRPPSVTELEIRDPAGRPLPSGAEGELYVRTPAQANGYWADPVESAEVFVDGWVRTRDLARLDSDGYLHLLGRTRDIIIVNANIQYAGPIERALTTHPEVAEAYVVGTPDEESGEAVRAFVVPVAGRVPDPDALRALVRGRLGEGAVPRTVTLIDEVPVAPSGKPDKRRLTAEHLPDLAAVEPVRNEPERKDELERNEPEPKDEPERNEPEPKDEPERDSTPERDNEPGPEADDRVSAPGG